MSKLPCEVVRDLFPSYIDELTREVTNNLVEEHILECEECSQILVYMKNPEAEPVEEKNKEEIDYLKKTRKKNRKHIGMVVAIVIALVMIMLGVRYYFVGTAVQHEYLDCQVEVVDNELSVKCMLADAKLCISDMDFKEDNGIVNIVCKGVGKSPFFERSCEETYVAEESITEVHLGERILWAKGKDISALTSAVYQTKHAYVGDMSANNKTANVLNMSTVLGNYKNQLQTGEEPYGWHFLMEFEPYDLTFIENYMQSYAYILLAVVENLGEVTYEFMYEGEPMVRTITVEMATSFVGKDIKTVGNDIVALQSLMEKTGLLNVTFAKEDSERNEEEEINIEIVNFAEDDISSIMFECHIDEDIVPVSTVYYSDKTLFQNGEVIPFYLSKDSTENDLWKNKKNFDLRILVNKESEATYDSGEWITVPMEFGEKYQYKLTGNRVNGYRISQ